MPRRTAPASSPTNMLPLPRVAHKRRSYDQRSGQCTKAAVTLFRAFSDEPEFVETVHGDMIRVWGPNDWRRMKNEDVKIALQGKAGFDHDELLQWIPPQTIKDAVSRGWLHASLKGGLYRVTRKAAVALDLPRTVRGRKINFLDTGL